MSSARSAVSASPGRTVAARMHCAVQMRVNLTEVEQAIHAHNFCRHRKNARRIAPMWQDARYARSNVRPHVDTARTPAPYTARPRTFRYSRVHAPSVTLHAVHAKRAPPAEAILRARLLHGTRKPVSQQSITAARLPPSRPPCQPATDADTYPLAPLDDRIEPRAGGL